MRQARCSANRSSRTLQRRSSSRLTWIEWTTLRRRRSRSCGCWRAARRAPRFRPARPR
jgi:hypothetical protein